MTNKLPAERVTKTALHLAGGVTALGAFSPRLRQMHQQQAADQHPKLARSVLPSRVRHSFHEDASA